jgi:hypothetical protein
MRALKIDLAVKILLTEPSHSRRSDAIELSNSQKMLAREGVLMDLKETQHRFYARNVGLTIAATIVALAFVVATSNRFIVSAQQLDD